MNDNGTELHASPGQLMLLYPNVEHYGSRQSADVSFYWLHFFVEDGTLPFEQTLFEQFDHSYLFKELLHYNNLPVKPEYLVNAVLIKILAEMCFASQNASHVSKQIAEEIYEWIRVNSSASLTVQKTALHFHLSSDHISRVLKQNYGISAKALIDRFIVLKARELLTNTNLYIKEIAYRLDFASDNAFVGFFKYHEGVFPSEYRNQYYRIHINNH